MCGVGNLNRAALYRRLTYQRFSHADVAVYNGCDQFFIHAVAGAQLKFLAGVVERIDCAGVGAR